ncbi:MAG: hypothetical protein GXN99_02620 [Candidatus Nanohaloarchaeota archaeon]|nr:hypothetical protein [Candidatus Nanohaloarchaeota archaeon]
MWEVFALTSLIFAALGMLEYKKSSRSNPSYVRFNKGSNEQLHEEVRFKEPYAHANDEKEPESFIKLRFSEESNVKQNPQPSFSAAQPSTFSSHQDKEEAKRRWENHYIVRAVKERFAKKEERNYGVFHTESSQSQPSYNNVQFSSEVAPTPSNPPVQEEIRSSSLFQEEPASLLPEVPKENNAGSSSVSSSSQSQQPSLPGVFGSLLQQRNEGEKNVGELNLTSSSPSPQPSTITSESVSNDTSTSSIPENEREKEKKVEEFNPFDVLGNI